MPPLSTDALVRALRVPSGLVLDFYVTFGRFEYALKAAGFVHHPRGVAEADWHSFVTFLEQLEPAARLPVVEAGQQLIAEPPKKLVLDGTDPPWKPVPRGRQSNIRFLLEGVKRARNNLFHGGKWVPNPERPERNGVVVTAALDVLHALLEVPGVIRLRQAYDELAP
jgi:hypothetical protein